MNIPNEINGIYGVGQINAVRPTYSETIFLNPLDLSLGLPPGSIDMNIFFFFCFFGDGANRL